jgi:hypothetical protein
MKASSFLHRSLLQLHGISEPFSMKTVGAAVGAGPESDALSTAEEESEALAASLVADDAAAAADADSLSAGAEELADADAVVAELPAV